MNKADLVDNVAAKARLTKKDAEAAINAVIDTVITALEKGDKVTLSNFGVFEIKKRNPRVARNPRTNSPVEIEARNVCQFKPGKRLKDVVK